MFGAKYFTGKLTLRQTQSSKSKTQQHHAATFVKLNYKRRKTNEHKKFG